MKKNLLLIFLFFFIAESKAQSVVKEVHFDNYTSASNNDFTNNFSGNSGFTQIQTGGITGGCLATPDSNNWGNDNAWFCAKYEGNGPLNSVYNTWISFKYDSSIYNVNGFDRMVSIWLVPSADFNHYLIASVTHDKKLQILSYSYVNITPFSIAFQNNHWYRMQLQVTMPFTTADIGLSINMFDLGLSGMSTPVSAGAMGGNFNDSILVNDPDISIGITGTRYGGAIYLDDFHFDGEKGSDICPTTSISNAELNELISVKHIDDAVIINNKSADQLSSYIYDMNGKLLLNTSILPGINEISTTALPAGFYICHLANQKSSTSVKLIVTH